MPGADYQLWWDLHNAARAVLNRRYVRSDAPRVKIHLADPGCPTPDQRLDLEFAFVSLRDSCKVVYGVDVFCQRAKWHPADFHAAGYGPGRVRWPAIPPEPAEIVWQ